MTFCSFITPGDIGTISDSQFRLPLVGVMLVLTCAYI